MRSKIATAGHPLHPMLVLLPIGLLVGSVLADIAFLLTGREQMWYDIAFWALIAGVVTALVAATAGFGAYLAVAVHTDARGMATAHMLINIVAVVVFAVSTMLRLDNGAVESAVFTTAFALSLVGIAGLAVSGWLGGEMSYRKHLGVIPDTAEEESREARRHMVHLSGKSGSRRC